jgi:hypothetical protein
MLGSGFHACAEYSYGDLGSLPGLGYLGFWLDLASATSDSLSHSKKPKKIRSLRLSMATKLGILVSSLSPRL